ncbi:MAG TPA: 4Fe-4S binding protein [Longilinea sp.]|nr:4Fe-4S binding protein [Longilinea sp.]
MRISPSTRKFLEEANRIKGYPLSEKLHGYFYMRWPVLYIATATGTNRLGRLAGKVISGFNRIFPPKPPKPEKLTVADTYHGKVVSLESARQLVSVKQAIRVDDLERVIPYKQARSLILDHPEHIVAMDCPCRMRYAEPCLPLGVCIVIGEPFASFTLEHHPQHSRAITSAEAVEILEAEEARGHVHHAFFKEATLQRFYTICNCCACHCAAIQAHKNGTPMLASSGYVAHVDAAKCSGCGQCVKFCQFNAPTLVDGVSFIDPDVCMGCGVCASHCKRNAIDLVLTPEKGVPLEMGKIMEQAAKNA